MKFAISYSPPYHGVDPDTIVGYAQHAEECGFEGFYLPERSYPEILGSQLTRHCGLGSFAAAGTRGIGGAVLDP